MYIHARISVCVWVQAYRQHPLLLLSLRKKIKHPVEFKPVVATSLPGLPLTHSAHPKTLNPHPSPLYPSPTSVTLLCRVAQCALATFMWFSVNLVPANASRLLNKEAPPSFSSHYVLSTTSLSFASTAAAAAASACASMPVIRAMSPSNVPVMRAIFACHAPLPKFATRLRKYQRLFGIYQAATCCSCQDEAEQTEEGRRERRRLRRRRGSSWNGEDKANDKKLQLRYQLQQMQLDSTMSSPSATPPIPPLPPPHPRIKVR